MAKSFQIGEKIYKFKKDAIAGNFMGYLFGNLF